MYRLACFTIVLISFSLSASPQTMRKEDVADAIISAVEYQNDFDSHFTTNFSYMPQYTVFVKKIRFGVI